MRIKDPVEYPFEIERSRFIGLLYRALSVAEARAILSAVRKRYPDADHVAHAYRIGDAAAHTSDDGEPSGTAGSVMREVLEKEGITDIIALAVRYFGGVKLGAGGLSRAYARCVSGALALATYTEPRILDEYVLELDYPALSRIAKPLESRFTVVKTEYARLPAVTFRTDTDPAEIIAELTSGRFKAVRSGTYESEIIIRKPLNK